MSIRAITQGLGKVELFTFVWMFALTTFGIGAGMHRLFVHRSFRTGPITRVFFCAIAQMAVQGSIAKWVANHRRHHLYADDVGDPHSPQFDGFGNRYLSALKGFCTPRAAGCSTRRPPKTNITPRTSSSIRSRCSSCHRFPRDAYISHAWWEIDLNGLIILGMEKIGLVHDVFHASHRQLELASEADAQAATTAR
jgi:fatty-acid desaturase